MGQRIHPAILRGISLVSHCELTVGIQGTARAHLAQCQVHGTLCVTPQAGQSSSAPATPSSRKCCQCYLPLHQQRWCSWRSGMSARLNSAPQEPWTHPGARSRELQWEGWRQTGWWLKDEGSRRWEHGSLSQKHQGTTQMGFIFIYSGSDLLEGNPSAVKSEQDSWGAMEALTVPPTENKGLCRAGSDFRIQMSQME